MKLKSYIFQIALAAVGAGFFKDPAKTCLNRLRIM